jgi:hypothetical protein
LQLAYTWCSALAMPRGAFAKTRMMVATGRQSSDISPKWLRAENPWKNKISTLLFLGIYQSSDGVPKLHGFRTPKPSFRFARYST